eukprot:PhF_6_TR4209/c0_g1_i1/m.5672/K03671/trxA; thioredoxin 1
MRRFLRVPMFRPHAYAVSAYTAADGDIAALASPSKVVVIDFSAEWCGPCKAVAPQFETMSNKYTDVKFVKVDVDDHGAVAGKFSIRAVPTFVVLKDGKIAARVEGASMAAVENAIKDAK